VVDLDHLDCWLEFEESKELVEVEHVLASLGDGGLYKCTLPLGLHSLFWARGHSPSNENRAMGFHNVFMVLFTPRQTT